MKNIFITGTDTGVGKTVITGLLGRYLREKGYYAITQKWIQTGNYSFPGDIKAHLELMQLDKNSIKEYLPFIAPYIFKFLSSPHLAARLEKKRIDQNKIKESFKFLSKKFNPILVESSGGVLVPFNEKKLIIDIAKDLKLSALIVTGNKIGAINHTLLTIEALEQRNMNIIGIIFNNSTQKTKDIILKDNMRIIEKLKNKIILGSLPRIKGFNSLYRKFIPIAKKIVKNI